MSNEESDLKQTESIIEDHKKMVIMTGSLSDFQLNNLKTWPFLLFDELETAEITYDFTKLVGEQSELSPGTVQFNFIWRLNRCFFHKIFCIFNFALIGKRIFFY